MFQPHNTYIHYTVSQIKWSTLEINVPCASLLCSFGQKRLLYKQMQINDLAKTSSFQLSFLTVEKIYKQMINLFPQRINYLYLSSGKSTAIKISYHRIVVAVNHDGSTASEVDVLFPPVTDLQKQEREMCTGELRCRLYRVRCKKQGYGQDR